MSIPGLALPGLTSTSTPQPALSLPPTAPPTHTQTLAAGTEYRFEISFASSLRIKLLTGTAELFGTELAPALPYTFTGTKAAIYTWHGCTLEITGTPDSEYVGEETPMAVWANVHFALEGLREAAKARGKGGMGVGPRVMVVGPENAGKSSLVRVLAAYAVRAGRQPVVVNLDPRQGVLSVPGTLTATAMASVMDVEEGWGSSPISGPSATPVKMPLCYCLGCGNVEEGGRVFRPLVTRLALAVTSRLEEDEGTRDSGYLIDTPGSISGGKGGVYENIQHVVSEFSVNVLLVLGSERLYSDMSRRYANQAGDDAVAVIKLTKSEGCVDRDESYMRQLRQSQIRSYFFGREPNTLSPFTQMVDFAQLSIYKVIETPTTSSAWRSGDEDEDVPSAGTPLYEKVQPSMGMQNCLLAVTHADSNASQDVIRDSSIMGYVYVAEVDEAKSKVRLLAPVSGRVPPRAMIWGSWPEPVPDLVG